MLTVDWLIKIARLICEPLGTGRLYTHTTDTTSYWYNLDRTSDWRQVVPGDQLLPGIYEFESANPIILSKISERQLHSITTDQHRSSSTNFNRHIMKRDGEACVVTGYRFNVIASHLISKRLGDDGAIEVMSRFSGRREALTFHKFDPRIGILLTSNLDLLVDRYQLGFYHDTGDTYTLHNFYADEPDMTTIGHPTSQINQHPLLHLFTVRLSIHDGIQSLPPKEVFDWHYLQCVIKVFGTPAYKNIPNITFYAHPFKTADDDDSDEYIDDGEGGPLYLSYNFDRYLKEQGRRQMALERHAETELWASGVPSCLPDWSTV